MEIKEIDGKKFIEFEQHKLQRKKLIISIIFLVLILIATIALVNATMILIKNRDIIGQDPLRYGMDLHNFTSCQCLDVDGKDWKSNELGFIHVEQVDPTEQPSFSFNISNFGVRENRTG